MFLKLGADPPRKFLECFGVQFTSPDAEAKPVLSRAYESSVPGLFLIGAASGRDLIKLGMNQGCEVVEHLMGRDVEPADEAVLRGVSRSGRERCASASGGDGRDPALRRRR